MLTITVAQDGSGDFASIAEAVLAVPYEEEALVQVGPGLYREKLVCEKRCITLRGAGADRTRLVWGDGGKLPHKDGRPTHTFRSYTAFFSGGTLCVEDMTIENDAGPGAQAGQAVAAYVDSTRAVFSSAMASMRANCSARPCRAFSPRSRTRWLICNVIFLAHSYLSLVSYGLSSPGRPLRAAPAAAGPGRLPAGRRHPRRTGWRSPPGCGYTGRALRCPR